MMEFVSWDDDIPNILESHKIPWFQTTNQSHIALFGNPTKSCHQGGTSGLEPPSAASKPMRQGRRLTMEAPGFAKELLVMEVHP
jgi:hypothetical protein